MPTFGRPFPARKTLLALALAIARWWAAARLPKRLLRWSPKPTDCRKAGSLREAEQLYAKAARQHDDLPDLWLGRGRNALKTTGLWRRTAILPARHRA